MSKCTSKCEDSKVFRMHFFSCDKSLLLTIKHWTIFWGLRYTVHDGFCHKYSYCWDYNIVFAPVVFAVYGQWCVYHSNADIDILSQCLDALLPICVLPSLLEQEKESNRLQHANELWVILKSSCGVCIFLTETHQPISKCSWKTGPDWWPLHQRVPQSLEFQVSLPHWLHGEDTTISQEWSCQGGIPEGRDPREVGTNFLGKATCCKEEASHT